MNAGDILLIFGSFAIAAALLLICLMAYMNDWR